jgi:nicotinate-nucleotide adenylyltransferase
MSQPRLNPPTAYPTRPLVLGGSFNPIHIAHIRCAASAFSQLKLRGRPLDGIIIMPAWRSPFKTSADLADSQHRLRMCELAVAKTPLESNARVVVSDLELSKPTASYTFDTARALSSLGVSKVSWLVGTDHLPTLHQWHRFDELIHEIDFVVMRRADEVVDATTLDPRVARLASNLVEVPALPISSSDIRQKLRTNQDVSDLLHPDVLSYIRAHYLYA